MTRFSQRHGFQPPPPDILVRNDAPEELRGVVADIAYECGLQPSDLRSIICRTLRVREDPNNWSEFPNVDSEVRGHLDTCAWFEVYDLIEKFRSSIASRDGRSYPKGTKADTFDRELNDYFIRRGIGWQMRGGLLEIRGPETFEHAVTDAVTSLSASGRQTARAELHEALRDLARRPSPDFTGAMQHSLAALECVARDAAGDPKATLGAILSRHKDIVPRPLDSAIEKLWGFASERGRHLREGGEPGPAEVELAVHVAAAVANYLAKSLPLHPSLESPPTSSDFDGNDIPF